MIKGSIHQEDIKRISISASNLRAPKLTRQMLKELKGEIHNNIMNNVLSVMHRTTSQKNKKIQKLNNTVDQSNLTDI